MLHRSSGFFWKNSRFSLLLLKVLHSPVKRTPRSSLDSSLACSSKYLKTFMNVTLLIAQVVSSQQLSILSSASESTPLSSEERHWHAQVSLPRLFWILKVLDQKRFQGFPDLLSFIHSLCWLLDHEKYHAVSEFIMRMLK